MNADEREEIAASVAAHAELGPRYDSAVAEGLVERIGEEIDRRVDARLRGMGQQSVPQQPAPRQGYLSPGHQIVPPGYGSQAAGGPAATQPAPVPPPGAPPAQHRRNGGVSAVFLGLGSMGLGVGATAVVVSSHAASAAAVIMVLLIWFVIGAINIAHSKRP